MEQDEVLLDAETKQPLGALFHVVEIARIEARPVPAGCVAVSWIVAIDGYERELVGLGIGAVEVLDGEQRANLVEPAFLERQQCLLLHGEARVGRAESRVVGGVHPVVACRSDGDVARTIGIAEVQARRINLDRTMVIFCRGRTSQRTYLAIERSDGRLCGVAPKAFGSGHKAYLPDFVLLVLPVVISRHNERVVPVDERGAQFKLERISFQLGGRNGQRNVVVPPSLHALRERYAW